MWMSRAFSLFFWMCTSRVAPAWQQRRSINQAFFKPGLSVSEVDQPCRPGSPSLQVRPFVPLHPEFHSITQSYHNISQQQSSQGNAYCRHRSCTVEKQKTLLLLCCVWTTSQKFVHTCFFCILTTFYAVKTLMTWNIWPTCVDKC